MARQIFVGNLPLTTTEDEISALFREFGTVEQVRLVTAMETGESRGAGYVAMTSGARAAIEALDCRSLGDRKLRVKPALPRCRAGLSRIPRRARRFRAEEALATA